jgi:hypothetical protein
MPLQNKKNKATKERNGITHFNHYVFDYKGKKWLLQNAVYKNGYETPYSIKPN